MSAAKSRQSCVAVRSCNKMMRSMRSGGVAKTSQNEKMPALLTSTSTAMPCARVQSNNSCAAVVRARSREHVRTSMPPAALNFRFHDVEPLGPLAYQDDAVTQSRQLQGITASDSGTGAGNQSPSGSANDFTAFHITEVSLIPRVSCAAGQGNVCNISCRRNTSAQCNSCGGRTRCGSKRRPRGAY